MDGAATDVHIDAPPPLKYGTMYSDMLRYHLHTHAPFTAFHASHLALPEKSSIPGLAVLQSPVFTFPTPVHFYLPSAADTGQTRKLKGVARVGRAHASLYCGPCHTIATKQKKKRVHAQISTAPA